MKGVDIDAALLEFGGAVARFRSLAHGARRPQRSRWWKWWLCRERRRGNARAEDWFWFQYLVCNLASQTSYPEEAAFCAETYPAHWRKMHRHKRAAERYRRMLWGRKPFGKGQG